MSVFYLDSGAWVKRYFQEPGRERVMRLFDGGERLATSGLGYVEVAAALARRQSSRGLDEPRLRQLQDQLKVDWNDLTGLPLTQELVERAVGLAQRYRLRGADAVHLATALGLADALRGTGEVVILVASDQELLDAARAVGLEVRDPIAGSPRPTQ